MRRQNSMQRRTSLPLVAIASSSPSGWRRVVTTPTSTPATEPTTGETLPPVDTRPTRRHRHHPRPTPGADGIEHPTGADDVVVRIGYEGGFVPVEYVFSNLPTLLVTGDGRVIVAGPADRDLSRSAAAERAAAHDQRSRHPGAAALAEEHGLLPDVEYYEPDTNIADAPTRWSRSRPTARRTSTGLRARHGRRRHRDRRGAGRSWPSFVAQASDVVTAAGADTLGPEEPFERRRT